MSRLLREIVTNTLRASLLTVGAFLLAYTLVGLASTGDYGPVNLGSYSGIVVFGLLLALPFCLPIVVASILVRMGYMRYVRGYFQDRKVRTALFLVLLTVVGLLQTLLWMSVQNLQSLSTDLTIPFYSAGLVAGLGCGFFALRDGWGDK